MFTKLILITWPLSIWSPLLSMKYTNYLGKKVNRVGDYDGTVYNISTLKKIDKNNYTEFENCLSFVNKYQTQFGISIIMGPLNMCFYIPYFLKVNYSFVKHFLSLYVNKSNE